MSEASAAGVRVRAFAASDVAALRDGLASGSIAVLTRFMFPRSLAAVFGEYDHFKKARSSYRFAILSGHNVIGICTLRPPLFSGSELTIAIFDRKFQGRGIGTRVVREICGFGFAKLKLHRIELGVYPDNLRAQRCYLRCGFKKEATLRRLLYNDGRYRDVVWMSLLRDEWKAASSALDRALEPS